MIPKAGGPVITKPSPRTIALNQWIAKADHLLAEVGETNRQARELIGPTP